jgi:5-formyltetrahydrofolate cyclo-ligase
LRAQMRAQRKAISVPVRKAAARKLAQQALKHQAIHRARTLALPLSFASEIDTQPLLNALLRAGKRVYVPKVRQGKMIFVRYAAPFQRHALGFRQPARSQPRLLKQDLDVLLLPLLAFDAQGNRLGQGGGYYDRYLAGTRFYRCYGLAFACQQVAHVPTETHDARLHGVFTEQRFCRASTAWAGLNDPSP